MSDSTPLIHSDQYKPYHELFLNKVTSSETGQYYYSNLIGSCKSEDIFFYGELRDPGDPPNDATAEGPSGWRWRGYLHPIGMLLVLLGRNEGTFLKYVRRFEKVRPTAGIDFIEIFSKWRIRYLDAEKIKKQFMNDADVSKDLRRITNAKKTFLKYCDGILQEDDLKRISEHIDAALTRSKPMLHHEQILFMYRMGFLPGIDAPLVLPENRMIGKNKTFGNKFSKEDENLNSLLRSVDDITKEQIPAVELSQRMERILRVAGVPSSSANLRQRIIRLRKHTK